MKTYRFYLKASKYFLNPPNSSTLDDEEMEYNNIASVLLSWMCLESYINAMCASMSKGTRLKDHERAFLLEQELKVNKEGNFSKVGIKPSTMKKTLFLIHHFSAVNVKDFQQDKRWEELKAFEDLRNKIVHHKEKNNFKIDYHAAATYRDLVDHTINFLSKLLTRIPRRSV